MEAYIHQTAAYVRGQLAQAEAGHDWWHIRRVWNHVKLLLQHEAGNQLVCELSALLHDIADSKFHGGDETIGPRIAGEFLDSIGVDAEVIVHVQHIIGNLSYSVRLGVVAFHSKELEIVQDADRLDAMGAIGIARTFHYGGYRNRALYNPDIPPNPGQNKEAYKSGTAPTINHFYEKLLLLKDQMNTATAKLLAEERHQFMERYLEQFHREWGAAMP